MNYNEILYQLLSADTALMTIVNNQVYPVTISQAKQMPAIAYTKAVIPVDGYVGTNCTEQVDFNIYLFDDHPDDLDLIAREVRRILDDRSEYTHNGMHLKSMTFIRQDHEFWDKDNDKYFIALQYKSYFHRS